MLAFALAAISPHAAKAADICPVPLPVPLLPADLSTDPGGGDDYTLQACIDTLDGTGGELFLGCGIFDAEVGLVLAQDQHLMGSGSCTVLEPDSTGRIVVKSTAYTSGTALRVGVSKLRIDGNNAYTAIDLRGVKHGFVNRVYIGESEIGIYLGHNSYYNTIRDTVISQNNAGNSTYGIRVNGYNVTNPSENRIWGCSIQNFDEGVSVRDASRTLLFGTDITVPSGEVGIALQVGHYATRIEQVRVEAASSCANCTGIDIDTTGSVGGRAIIVGLYDVNMGTPVAPEPSDGSGEYLQFYADAAAVKGYVWLTDDARTW